MKLKCISKTQLQCSGASYPTIVFEPGQCKSLQDSIARELLVKYKDKLIDVNNPPIHNTKVRTLDDVTSKSPLLDFFNDSKVG